MKLHKLIFLTLFICLSASVKGQTTTELKKKIEAMDREILQLQKDLKVAEKNKKLTLTQINAIKTQISIRQNKIEAINTQIHNLDNQISENTNRVHNLQGQLGELKKEYANMIRFAQRNKNGYNKLMFIFSSQNFNQAYMRIKYLQQFGQYRKKQAGYIEGKQKDLNQQLVVLDKDLKEKSNLLKVQENERKKLLESKAEQSKVLTKYTRQEKEYLQDIRKRKAQQAAMNNEFRAILKREMELARKREEEEEKAAAAKARAENRPVPPPKPKSANGVLTLAPEVAKLNAQFESNKGNLPWPVDNKLVTEKFGHHVIDAAGYDNDGITIQTSENAAVKAVFSGTVSRITPIQGRPAIVIKHGLYYTVYMNLKSASVSVGDKVNTRQTIGVAGSNSGVPQINFQIRKASTNDITPLNPEYWLAQ